MTSFHFQKLEIPDVVLIEPRVFKDDRGFFMETYKWSDFVSNSIPDNLVQDNYSHSVKGVLRGLHYQQPPKAQGKLVMVIRGEIFDVAVDIRKGSLTYGKWVGVVLSSAHPRMVYVPVGFAHGFCVLSDEADVVYKVTGGEYAPELEGGIVWNDPGLDITWPTKHPLISRKDAALPRLQEAEKGYA